MRHKSLYNKDCLKNLKPWPKGKSANPGGVPAGKRITTWMMELGQMDELPSADDLPINGKIALARLKSAMGERGERSTEIILEHTESKPISFVRVLEPEVGEQIDNKLASFENPNPPIANA